MSSSSGLDDFLLVGSAASGADDPLSQLEKDIGYVVAAFADGRQVIKRSMKEDEMIAESLVKMEQVLKSHGDRKAAHRLARTPVYLWVHAVCCMQGSKPGAGLCCCISSATQVKLARDALNESANQVLPMKKHIEEIAELLNEMVDLEVHADTTSLAAIMRGVHEQSQGAYDIASSGKAKLQAVTEALQQIREEHTTKQQTPESQANVEKHKKKSNMKFEESIANFFTSAMAGMSGAGFAAAAAFGITAFSAPVVGPVAPAVSCGVLCASYHAVKGVRALQEHQEAEKSVEESKEAAQKQASESFAMAQKAEQCKEVVNAQVAKANAHADMWGRVCMAAESAAQIDLTVACGQKFKEKMKNFASSLKIFAEAIDEYLFFLDKINFFPLNFHIEHVLGKEKFQLMERNWNAAASQMARARKQCGEDGCQMEKKQETSQSLEDVKQGNDCEASPSQPAQGSEDVQQTAAD